MTSSAGQYRERDRRPWPLIVATLRTDGQMVISERRRLAVGTGWTLLSTLIALAVSAVLNPVIVLYLGVAGYGEWAAAVAVASLFGVGGDLGVAGALTKFTAERQGRQQDLGSLAGNALLFAVLAGCVAGGLLATLASALARDLAYPDFAVLLQIQAAQMPVNLGIASLVGLYQGRRLFRSLAVISILLVTGSFGLTIAFLVAGRGINGVMIASLATSVAIFLALVLVRKSDLRIRGYAALVADFRALVPFGIRLTLANAFSVALYQIDLVILTFLTRDPEQLGLYALATFVTRGLWIIPGSIGVTTYPVISEYAAASRNERVARYMSTALVASIAITGVLSTGFVLFGRPAIEFVFGRSASSSFDLGLLMLLGTAFFGCLRSVGSALSSVGRPDVSLRISMLGAGLLLVLSVPLVTGFAAAGAAIAVTLAFSVVAIVLVWSLQRYVLQPQGVAFDTKRAAQTGLLAVVLVGASLFFSLPTNPSLESSLIAGLLCALAVVVMVEISGGRQTWAALMTRPRGQAAKRD